eukprot:scaffold741_cov336-Pavlova_lutheri.AAC.53
MKGPSNAHQEGSHVAKSENFGAFFEGLIKRTHHPHSSLPLLLSKDARYVRGSLEPFTRSRTS